MTNSRTGGVSPRVRAHPRTYTRNSWPSTFVIRHFFTFSLETDHSVRKMVFFVVGPESDPATWTLYSLESAMRFLGGVCAALLVCGAGLAGEMVGVNGSKVRFPAQIEVPNGGKPVKLALTGAALRTRTIITQYAVASYLQEGVKAKSAEQLVAADSYKALHLILESNLSGRELADSLSTAIRTNSPKGFTSELQQLRAILGDQTFKAGQEITFTWLPKSGVRFQVKGKTDV